MTARLDDPPIARLPQYRALFQDAPDGWLLTGLTGTIRDANRAAGVLLRAEHPSVLGRPLREFLVPEEQPRFDSHLLRLRSGGQRRRAEWEVQLQPRAGAPFPATLAVSRVRSPAGEVVALQWLLRDISRQKQLEAEQEQLLWELLRRRQPGTPSKLLLPVCANCQRVRRGEATWTDLPAYLAVHLDLQFTHGLCPDCLGTLYPEVYGRPAPPDAREPELPLQYVRVASPGPVERR